MSSSEMTFQYMIKSYLEDSPDLKPNTVRNYNAVLRKLEKYAQVSGVSLNVLEYDILNVQDPMMRREKIKAFNAMWNGFTLYLKTEHKLVVQTRNTYRQIFHAIVKYSEKQFGVRIVMDSREKAMKYSDRKLELKDDVVRHLMTLNPGLHWTVNICKLALYSCWRVSDLIQIRVDDLVLGEFLGQKCYYISRVTQKTGKPMKTPVPVGLIRDIMRRNGCMPGDLLLRHPSGRVLTAVGVVDGVRTLFNLNQFLRGQTVTVFNVDGETIQQPLSMVNRPMHLLRAAGASYLIQRGMTPDSVAKWFTGHESSQVLKDHYITGDNFTGAKELFKERFAVANIRQSDDVNRIFDEHFQNGFEYEIHWDKDQISEEE
ncbi:MAG: site-specific integrase [Caulobacteraceae bacterium]|nr:site-specific integrase [Caulobacteraceae bacterium]